ncbi:helix-turn-helix domain-containing protein [Amphritea sp. 1_MG-2023]|uniref:helix-turn-helix domain-containing protein n=1 Tax=Amphritea sp. 1_MG-2023 TaxID=3062670 RepID=UPI0026E1C24F|nr:helix-turn-helix domain-containing protein [Amphritea sp. 1_MG-2023]MDO6562640.1 helix-turn-helix domain-containing protein [Amphritea sp. 1_MG-2023]
MSERNLSITERWIQQYEQAHPEVLNQGWNHNQDQRRLPSTSLKPATPSQQSKTGGNACLWNALPETVLPESQQRIVDPVVLAAIHARKSLKLTQAKFARCLGLSPRTVSEWEQGRRQPSGAARTLLHWVVKRPDYVKEALKTLQQ